MDYLSGKKTYIVALAMILYAVIVEMWQNGNTGTAYTLIMEALAIAGLRAGVAKMK